MDALQTGMKTFSRIFSLSFSGKKIALQIGGMVCAVAASLVIMNLLGGFVLRGQLQSLVAILNWVAVLFILFFTWGAIAKVTVAEVAGLPAVDFKGALHAVRVSATPLIIAPLKIVLIILLMVLCHSIAGWFGRIPFLGEIVWPFLALPLFFLSALLVAAGIILLCGTLLLPPIIMVGKESPVSELNDFIRANTVRFIGYLIATALVFIIIVHFLSAVTAVDAMISSRTMGAQYTRIVSSVPPAFNRAFDCAAGFFSLPECSSPPAGLVGRGLYAAPQDTLRWTYSFAGFIWGAFTLIIRLSILSIPFVVWCVSGTLIYLGLKPEAAPKP